MRVHPLLVATVMAGLTLAATPGQTAAQELSLSILNAGKVPVNPVPVKDASDDEDQVLGVTDSMGRVKVQFSALDVPVGTDIAVHMITCDSDTEIVLVSPGQSTDADEDCDDDRIGALVWGRTSTASINISKGTLTTGTLVQATNPWKPRLTLGVGASYFTMPDLEETGCLGAPNCEVDDSGLMGRLFLEYEPFEKLPIHLGIGGSFGTFGVSQDFGGGDTNVVDVDVTGFSGYTGYFHRNNNVRFAANVGLSWLRNDAKIFSNIGGETFQEDRDESGIRFLMGASVDYGLSESIGLRFDANYIKGDEHDADTNFNIGLAAMIMMGGGY